MPLTILPGRVPLDVRADREGKDKNKETDASIRFHESELLGDNEPAIELWEHYTVCNI